MSAPTSLRAGDSVAWTETLPEYPPTDGWVLKYRALYPTGPAVDIASTPSGDAYAVALTPAATAAFTPGRASLVSWVERADERITLGAQPLEILPDLATVAEFDGRSANERGLADARAALDKYVRSGRGHVEEYEVAGRRLRFRSLQDITDLIEYYEKQVAADRALAAMAAGVSAGRVQVKF